jgi:hypothetical protein
VVLVWLMERVLEAWLWVERVGEEELEMGEEEVGQAVGARSVGKEGQDIDRSSWSLGLDDVFWNLGFRLKDIGLSRIGRSL